MNDKSNYDVEATREALRGAADNAPSGETVAREARRVMTALVMEAPHAMIAILDGDTLSLKAPDGSAPVVVTFRQEGPSFGVRREGRQGWEVLVELRGGILWDRDDNADALVSVARTIKRMFGPVENFSGVTLA
ncbi:MAG TPA: hypothetical protein VNO30_20615 [Kofleriaceae bacterium]|nr:hypothetical protein [Kofleriaceae bacterium]